MWTLHNKVISCILQVWDHGSALQACKCPLCRRPITLLVPSESASRLHQDLGVPEVLRRVEQYNRHFGQHANGLLQVFLSGIYVLSPVDLIPEGFLGIIGLLDDLIIMFICFLHVAALYRSVLLFRHGGS
ncbi:ATP-dependent protease La domain-containing protein isoform 1 [Capsicum annuum]|nr:ATP-dependent protease La domain-containing protein isoform 1 [Capsicum annuum]